MTQYVRLTFKPAGSKRKRTTWAVKTSARSYLACDKEGETWFMLKGKETQEMILVSPNEDFTELPARMNNKYGELELAIPDETMEALGMERGEPVGEVRDVWVRKKNPAPASLRIPIPSIDELFERQRKELRSFTVDWWLDKRDIAFFSDLLHAVWEAMPDLRAPFKVSVPALRSLQTPQDRNIVSISAYQNIWMMHGKHDPRPPTISFSATRQSLQSLCVIIQSEVPTKGEHAKGKGARDMNRAEFESAGWVPIPPIRSTPSRRAVGALTTKDRNDGKTVWYGPPRRLIESFGLHTIRPIHEPPKSGEILWSGAFRQFLYANLDWYQHGVDLDGTEQATPEETRFFDHIAPYCFWWPLGARKDYGNLEDF